MEIFVLGLCIGAYPLFFRSCIPGSWVEPARYLISQAAYLVACFGLLAERPELSYYASFGVLAILGAWGAGLWLCGGVRHADGGEFGMRISYGLLCAVSGGTFAWLAFVPDGLGSPAEVLAFGSILSVRVVRLHDILFGVSFGATPNRITITLCQVAFAFVANRFFMESGVYVPVVLSATGGASTGVAAQASDLYFIATVLLAAGTIPWSAVGSKERG